MRSSAILLTACLAAVFVPLGAAHGSCSHQSVHTYGGSSVAGAGVDTFVIQAGGQAFVDTNTADCDGDGIAPDFDGDYDAGESGGFLPADHHTPTIYVQDITWGSWWLFYAVGTDGNGDGLVTPDAPDCLEQNDGQNPFTTSCLASSNHVVAAGQSGAATCEAGASAPNAGGSPAAVAVPGWFVFVYGYGEVGAQGPQLYASTAGTITTF